jgi:hypothetical protein
MKIKSKVMYKSELKKEEKYMEKDRGFKIIAIFALVFSVVGLSIAYAAYTSTLTVAGTATATPAWKIVWKSLDAGTPTGYASVANKTLAIDSTEQAISGFIGTLKAPGDTIEYTWKVKNDGEINATLSGVTLGALSCQPAATHGSTAAEATALCEKLSVAFKYDGATLTSSTTGSLNATAEKNVSMKITYNDVGNTVDLSGDVAITLGTTSFTYNQAPES